MTPRQLAEPLALAALWGGSFLCMRLGASDFGSVALVFVRCAGAAALLLPVLLLRAEVRALRVHWRLVALVGAINSAGPFVLFAAASLVLSAGLMAVFNATAPLCAAAVAWVEEMGQTWLAEPDDDGEEARTLRPLQAAAVSYRIANG